MAFLKQKPILLLLSLTCIAQSTHAVDTSKEGRELLLGWKQRYAAIVSDCLDKDFSDVACKYANVSMLKHNALFGTLEVVTGKGLDKVGHVMWGALDYLKIGETDPKAFAAARILNDYDNLKVSAKAKVKREKLKPCQRACLAVCMSSKVINYVDGWQSTARGAIAAGGGVCREFSRIGEDLMDSFGLDSWVVGGRLYRLDKDGKTLIPWDYHAMVALKIDGQKYTISAQNDECTFHPYEFGRDPKKEGGTNEIEGEVSKAEGGHSSAPTPEAPPTSRP